MKRLIQYTLWTARRAGKIDGGLDPAIPSPTAQQNSPHCREIERVAEGMCEPIASKHSQRDARHWQSFVCSRLDGEYSHKQATDAANRLHVVEDEYLRLHGQRPPKTDLAYRLYLPIGFLQVIGETAFNATAFGPVSENEPARWLMAATVSCVLIGLAHLVGKFARQEHKRSPFILGWTCVAGAIAIGWFRANYLCYKQTLDHTYVPNPIVSGVAYAVLNIGLLVFSAAYSFWRSRPLLDHVFGERREVARWEQRELKASKRQARAHVVRATLVDRTRSAFREVVSLAGNLVEAYRTTNLRARRDREGYVQAGYPVSYSTPLSVAIPAIRVMDVSDGLTSTSVDPTHHEQFNSANIRYPQARRLRKTNALAQYHNGRRRGAHDRRMRGRARSASRNGSGS